MSTAVVAISPGFLSKIYLERKLGEIFNSSRPLSALLICEETSPARAIVANLVGAVEWIDVEQLSRARTREIITTSQYVVAFWDGETLSQIVFEARKYGIPIKVYPVDVTKVVNRNRDEKFDFYIGRGTPWGNPFIVGSGPGQHSRDEAVELYRKHFDNEILRNPSYRSRLLELRGYRLGCHCKPLACHGDIIASYLNSLDPEDSETSYFREKATSVVEIGVDEVTSNIASRSSERDHLFISYAIEDSILANWLSRKLALHGYSIWFDQIKLLGGEPWPASIDDAIKNRTFRMIALLSGASLRKQNPSKERALALAISKKREIDDFLITLKLDSSELDWLTSDISYISFNSGWMEGYRQLLKKLNSISAPKSLANPSNIVLNSLPHGEDLVSSESELLKANVIRVTDIPTALKGFRANQFLDDKDITTLESKWAFYKVSNDFFIGFESPPLEVIDAIHATQEQWSWNDIQEIRGIKTRNIVSNLLFRTLRVRLIAFGCLSHPKQAQTLYLPKTFTEDGRFRFVDYRGKRTWLKIQGRTTFVRPSKPRETNFHHFAFRLTIGRGIDSNFWIQVRPTLFFLDQNSEPIVDKRVGPRRRRLTKNWWNNKWMNRLLAAEQVLREANVNQAVITLTEGLLTLTAQTSLNESALLAETEATEEELETVENEVIVEEDEDHMDSIEGGD